MRNLSYIKIDDYFRSLAEKHKSINDYCGTSLDELQSKLTTADGIISPMLLLFRIENKLSGNKQRTFNNRTIYFVIAFSGIDREDFAAQRTAIDDAEAIGLQVISRINIESKKHGHWLYDNFDVNTVHFEDFEAEEVEGLFGSEFHFDLKVSEPLLVDPEVWDDGDQFCTP